MSQKETLRHKLFERFFKEKQAILLPTLIKKISPISNSWQQLRNILSNNIQNFDIYCNIEKINIITHNNNQYLIIKTNPLEYLIIDIKNQKVLKKEDIQTIFNENFFINVFNEIKADNIDNYLDIYYFHSYQGEINDLINFYIKNQNNFNLPYFIEHQVNIDNACSYININISNGIIQLGFITPDKSLYEQFFFNQDLTPYRLQDATHKMEKSFINVIIEKIKELPIAYSSIPKEFQKQIFPKLTSYTTIEFKENVNIPELKDIIITKEDQSIRIFYGSNGDLYFDIITKRKKENASQDYASFHINYKDYLYPFFQKLISDIVNCNVYEEFDDNPMYAGYPAHTIKRSSLNQKLREQKANNKILKNGIIEIYSDSISNEQANMLKISQTENEIILEFIRNKEDSTRRFSIRICNSGSKYHPFNICFMNLFSNIQNIAPKKEQINKKKRTP